MSPLRRIILVLKALREMGFERLGYYAWYQILLRSGYLKWVTRGVRPNDTLSSARTLQSLIKPPSREVLEHILGEEGIAYLISEADEVVNGRVRLFGDEAVPLRQTPPAPLHHWTVVEKTAQHSGMDVKFIWEPARFGWALSLGRAYIVGGDERYVETFWQILEEFIESNPPYMGLQWASAQEVALRLIAFVILGSIFASSPHSTTERMRFLSWVVAIHAARIPPTIAYAKAQNNNHLLSEAVGLYTAGLALPQHSNSPAWKRLGWKWFNQGIQTQVAPDGTYIQHSTNYHRLMLQLALWVKAITPQWEQIAPEVTKQRLAAATHWLFSILDPCSGGVPNLGPNDGAYIFPLTICSFRDYRPVAQAAAKAFLGERILPQGVWDEMTLWLCQEASDDDLNHPKVRVESVPTLTRRWASQVLALEQHRSWAYLRVARFTSRPGHADQLHLDLWWRGINLAQDAGTYLYNGLPPWDNALDRTEVHNTLTIQGRDQMRRAGRFLWLDWAQAWLVGRERAQDGEWERLIARHDGYRHLGLLHQRSVTAFKDGRWLIEDAVLHARDKGVKAHARDLETVTSTIQWLLPDWEWQIEVQQPGCELLLFSPFGMVKLRITPKTGVFRSNARLIRAGRVLYGSGESSPTWGWVSPMYGKKIPALSLRVDVWAKPPFFLESEWILPFEKMGNNSFCELTTG